MSPVHLSSFPDAALEWEKYFSEHAHFSKLEVVIIFLLAASALAFLFKKRNW
jgi:hypothetical protein